MWETEKKDRERERSLQRGIGHLSLSLDMRCELCKMWMYKLAFWSMSSSDTAPSYPLRISGVFTNVLSVCRTPSSLSHKKRLKMTLTAGEQGEVCPQKTIIEKEHSPTLERERKRQTETEELRRNRPRLGWPGCFCDGYTLMLFAVPNYRSFGPD